MLLFRVHVKYVDRVVDMDLIEPEDCSVISLINDAKKQHVLTTDEELMLCFELFDDRHIGIIDFKRILVSNVIHFLEDKSTGLLCFNEPVEENNAEPVEENYVEPVEANNEEDNVVLVEENSEEENVGGDAVNDGSDKCSVDNEYEVGEESEDDSNVSLVDENGDKDYGNKDHCQPDGDKTVVVVSSDEETTLTRIARYCQNHHWASNPNGTISFEDGQIIGNAKFTREVIKRLHASCLTDKVTFMIKSVQGSHLMCPRVAENKEATSRWVALVLGNFIRSSPNGKSKLFKNKLQERFTVKVDSQTIYMAKKIVVGTLKSHHVEAYAKLRKYGNAIRSYNPGTDVMGVLLSVTALHGDNCIIPIAVALANEWPNAYTRYCFRHIVANFMSTFRNHKINWKLWHVARAANRARFRQALASVREESENVANWLILELVEKWARHAFKPSLKVDHVSNNMLECFNSWIREDKDKLILQLLENFRRKIIVRLYEKWAEAEKLNDTITPYAGENLMMNEKKRRSKEAASYSWKRTLEWQMTGFLYIHAIVVFMYNKEYAHDHVHWYYSKEAWKMAYDGNINPIPDESRWPEFEYQNIELPVKKQINAE
ncbi:hypothetical protein EZV62_007994 [Acer yangbiense]|uniref:MULE transposase domain-containing protein n=1 Tax=Acer yangbiense TaxID=1000413 RepID=A0A5C7ICW4_9ROSI|nr:hypothetical protein EZV62_007994 [Acer yangbiense]